MIKKIVFNRYSLLLAAIIIILGISYYLFFPQFEVCVLGKRVFFSRFQAKQSITVPSGISQISITSSILCKEERTGSTGSEFLIPIGSVVKLSVGKKRYQLNFVSVKTLSEGYLFLKSDFTLNSLCRGKKRALVLIGTNEQNILTVYTFLNSHINMIALSNAPKDINNIVSCYDDKSTYIAYNSVVDKKVYVVKLEKNRLEIIFSLPSEYVSGLSLTPMKKGVALSVSDSINNFKNSVYQIYSSKSINISSLSMGSVVGSTLLGSKNYLYQLGLTENSGYGAVIEQFQNNKWYSLSTPILSHMSNANLVGYQNGIVALLSRSTTTSSYQILNGKLSILGDFGENEIINRNSLINFNNTLKYFYVDNTSQDICEKIWDGKYWEKSILFTSNYLNKYGTILAISDGLKFGYFVLYKEGTYNIYKIQQ